MFYNCDCVDGAIKYLADNSIDLIISDPPYGIDGDKLHKHYNRNEDKVLEGYVEVSETEYPEFSKRWIQQAARVLKPGGSIYIISGYSQLRHVLNALADTDLQEVNHLIWKYNFGVYTSKKYISSHYHILYYVKAGAKPIFNTYAFFSDTEKSESGGSQNYTDREDVWIINRENKPGEIKNKNELPKSLLKKMILYSSNPDDLICDFFLGSFSTAKVAVGLGRRACGFEISETAFNYQINKINEIKSGELLSELREIPANKLINRGKPLKSEELSEIKEKYKALIEKGLTKKASIEQITNETGRGYWSILKIVDGTTNKSIKSEIIEKDLFE